MWLGEDIPLLGDWLILNFTENPGMAFGMELGGDWGKIILSVFRVVAVIAIAFYIRSLIRKKAHGGLLIAIAFIFAGAMGNIIDSAVYGLIFSQSAFMEVAQFMPEGGGYAPFLYGNVVDMIQVKYFPAVFNLADFSITLGVILIIIRQRTFFPKPPSEDTEEEEALKAQSSEVDLNELAASSESNVEVATEESAASETLASEAANAPEAVEEAQTEQPESTTDSEDASASDEEEKPA